MDQWRTAHNDEFPLGDAGGSGGAGGGWGFDALDGSNQDWDNWFAGLEAPDSERRDFHSAATEPFAPLSDLRRGPPEAPRSAVDEPAPRTNTYPGYSPAAASAFRPTLSNPPLTTAQPRPSATARPPQPIAPVRQRDPPYVRPPHRRSRDSTLVDSESDDEAEEEESDYGPGVSIDDLVNDEDDEEDNAMPPATRRSHRSVVDLTNDSSSPPRSTTTRKRAREGSTRDATSNKRSRRSSAAANPIEELDLTAENPSAEEELLQTQQAAAIAAQQQQQQQASSGNRPLRVGQRTCIICMEFYTNATVTACGHIYCHECLTQALLAGEKNSERGIGNCPVCRKPVNRKKDKQMIPVNFMTREAFRAGRSVRA